MRMQWRLPSRLLLLAFLIQLLMPGQLQGETIRGVVRGASHAPLAGVRVAPEEFGASQYTESTGKFTVTLPPDVEKKGLVRLAFSLADHQTLHLDIKLPRAHPLEVTLIPLYARKSFLPNLSPGQVSRLRKYREVEIRRVHSFLASKEKKLLILEGSPGVGAVDLASVALQGLPERLRHPILWWDCEESDTLTLLAEDWVRAFQDQNLANLAQQGGRLKQTEDRLSLERALIAQLLAKFGHSPHTIVLTHFHRWLSGGEQRIEDVALADFLAKFVAHPQAGKLILLTDEKPVLPRDLNTGWVETSAVSGFAPDDAVDFLQAYFGLKASPELLSQAAERLRGNPKALELLAGSLADLEKKEQEDRLRQFLQVRESIIGEAQLQDLLASSYARLTSPETRVLDLLTIS